MLMMENHKWIHRMDLHKMLGHPSMETTVSTAMNLG